MNETATIEDKIINAPARSFSIPLLVVILLILAGLRMGLSLRLFERLPGHKASVINQSPNLLPNPLSQESWGYYYLNGAAQAKINVQQENVVITVLRSDSIDWHVICGIQNAKIRKSAHYIAMFRARTDTPREIGITVPSIYKNVNLGYDWRDYRLAFQATSSETVGVFIPQFNVGSREGRIWITDLRLTEVD